MSCEQYDNKVLTTFTCLHNDVYCCLLLLLYSFDVKGLAWLGLALLFRTCRLVSKELLKINQLINGKNGIPKKNHMKFQIMRKKMEFVDFSLVGPVSTNLLIDFEKFLRSKETSYQNSKNRMPSVL